MGFNSSLGLAGSYSLTPTPSLTVSDQNYIDFTSSIVNVKTSLIDVFATVGLSLNIISSDSISRISKNAY